MTTYREFCAEKAAVAPLLGRVVRDADIHPILKPHQRAIVACRRTLARHDALVLADMLGV